MSATWYYSLNQQQFGPVALEQLKALVTSGQMRREDMVWSPPMPVWKPAGEVAELGFPPPVMQPPAMMTAAPMMATPPMQPQMQQHQQYPPNVAFAMPYGGQAVAYAPAMTGGQSQGGMAITGFVLSLVGLLTGFVSILGLIFSGVALSNMKKAGNFDKKGLAVAGLVMGIIGVVGWLAWVGYVYG